jgi:endonuclease G
MLLALDQLNASAKRFHALPEEPAMLATTDFKEEAIIPDVSPKVTKGNIIGDNENMVKRKEMLEAVKQEPVDFALERAIGKNDAVYSNFVELIRLSKRKVGRIAVRQGNKNIGFATGFLVAENLMLTNWHVFKTIEEVAESEVQFFYEYDWKGNPQTGITFKFRSDVFYYSSQELDYCFVSVNPVDIFGTKKLADVGWIFLDPALGKLGNENEEALNIIHHPDGDYMQLSIRENLFVKISPTSIWYKTDTAPGSSGSPVFNDQWQVVALHHMGVGRKNEKGEYIDKDGKVIPNVDGKIDANRVVWDANEGIRISVILSDVFSKFPADAVINGLKNVPGGLVNEKESKVPDTNSREVTTGPANIDDNVTICFPPSLVEKNGYLNINIKQGTGVTVAKDLQPLEDGLEPEEIKKLEQSIDFTACKGYQSTFLGSGNTIQLPQPEKSIKKFIAKVSGTDSMILKYYKYSTIFHSVRMMPLISAINVDGDPSKRMDTAPRKDTWLRDTRLGYSIQLDDAYYKGSGFDKGHMSRREDADWGESAEEAKRNADLTCMYTNACPQVAKINESSRKGLWGILEKVVLETGAEAEHGKTAKISVFNGPIFKDDDPVFRGIQVPMDFYKIVLWLTDKGKLKATAFRLSQTKLVSDIDFEQLNVNENTEFKEYQCSIASLQNDTKIDFSAIIAYDTFIGEDANEVALNSKEEVVAHIRKHKMQ